MVDINIKIPAIEKLLDYTASGIGAVAGPIFLPWQAFWEGKARRISAKTDADVRSIQAKSEADSLSIIADAQAEARRFLTTTDVHVSGTADITRDSVVQHIEFQGRKRLANAKDIVAGAADVLGDKEVTDHEPDPDWTARFFDYAQDVSSEGLKSIWARILAGEVENPGRTSLRTLSVLRDMTQRDAEIFHSMMEYVVSDFILIDYCATASGNEIDAEIIALTNMGLAFSSMAVSKNITLGSDGTWAIQHHGHMLKIEGPANTNPDLMVLSHTVLTPQGRELAAFCKHEPNLQYLGFLAGWLTEHNCTLSLAPLISVEENGRMQYSLNAVRVIEPVTHAKVVA